VHRVSWALGETTSSISYSLVIYWVSLTPFKGLQAEGAWVKITRRWQLKHFLFLNPTRGNNPIWLIFFRWVETTNYLAILLVTFLGWLNDPFTKVGKVTFKLGIKGHDLNHLVPSLKLTVRTWKRIYRLEYDIVSFWGVGRPIFRCEPLVSGRVPSLKLT